MNLTIFKTVAAAVVLGATFAVPAQAQLAPYSEGFEGLDAADPAALGDNGWLVFGNVFDSGGNFLFGYGPFGAPNGGSGFSAIDSGQGGAGQGAQQLSIYNDYNCCQPSNGHFNGTDRVEANVFQEQIIGPGDVGSTWTFGFEYKAGTIDDDVNNTVAIAFIKTLDPTAGFALTNFVTRDTTGAPVDWTGDAISLTIDAGLVGQLLQFGFSSTTENFENSGVFYDNLSFSGPVDTDGDGVSDDTDNCTLVANPDQADVNGDDIGNRCDADVTGPGGDTAEDCFVNFLDLQRVKDAFFSNPDSPSWDPEVDFDGSNFVNFSDLQLVKDQLFGPPGPSAAGCN